jgi:hypothetical protein
MKLHLERILSSRNGGDIEPRSAVHSVEGSRPEISQRVSRYLSILVTDVISERSKYHIRIPMEFFKAGLDIGAIWAPELRNMNFAQILEDVDHFTDGVLLEVEDFSSSEKMTLSISRG